MATCPYCLEFLSETHRCTQQKRRRVRRTVVLCVISVVSGVVAILVSESALWGVSAAVVGPMATSALWRE